MALKDILRDAGIIGAGGAGFPAYMKLTPQADILLIDGAECEPLLYTDFILMRDRMDTVVRGARAIMEEYGIQQTLLCMKQHTAFALSLSDGEEIGEGVYVKVLPDVYPMGDEIIMIYEATGRVVRPGALPSSVGVMSFNVETVYNVARAVHGGEVLTEKWLTIGGAVEQALVVRCPVGTPVRDLFAFYGIDVPADHVLIDGGPSMGQIVSPYTAVVRKNTKALLLLPRDIPAVTSKLTDTKVAISRCASNCCQCTRCTDMCPRGLLGYPLEPHRMVRCVTGVAEITPEMVRAATLCCGCGICETLACCQGISPKTIISEFKKILAKNKIRYTSDTDVTPDPEREYRMIPATRWASALGVRPLDKVAIRAPRMPAPGEVSIPLRGHIGAPSVPCVKEGDTVTVGQCIAQAADGLSVPQHASIDGKVTLVTDEKITIERV